MDLATLTAKGQVTIPKEVRELLHLHSGDKIEFFIKESGSGSPYFCESSFWASKPKFAAKA